MTTADHIAALAERAQAAVASITPDPIQWAESLGASVNLTLNDSHAQLHVHHLDFTLPGAITLLRDTYPAAEVQPLIFGNSSWVVARFSSDGFSVEINVYTRYDA